MRRDVRRGALLQPADRRMLQAVRDNLSHVRHSAGINTSQRHEAMMDVQNGTTERAMNGSRLDFNKKAMDEIRQSLQNYHVTHDMTHDMTSSSHVTMSHSANVVRHAMLMSASEASENFAFAY